MTRKFIIVDLAYVFELIQKKKYEETSRASGPIGGQFADKVFGLRPKNMLASELADNELYCVLNALFISSSNNRKLIYRIEADAPLIIPERLNSQAFELVLEENIRKPVVKWVEKDGDYHILSYEVWLEIDAVSKELKEIYFRTWTEVIIKMFGIISPLKTLKFSKLNKLTCEAAVMAPRVPVTQNIEELVNVFRLVLENACIKKSPGEKSKEDKIHNTDVVQAIEGPTQTNPRARL